MNGKIIPHDEIRKRLHSRPTEVLDSEIDPEDGLLDLESDEDICGGKGVASVVNPSGRVSADSSDEFKSEEKEGVEELSF